MRAIASLMLLLAPVAVSASAGSSLARLFGSDIGVPRDWLKALDDAEKSNTNTHRQTADAAPVAAAASVAAVPAADVEDPRTIHHFSFDWSGIHDHHKPTLPPSFDGDHPSIPGIPAEHRYLAWTSENEENGELVRRQQQAGNGEAFERTFTGSFNWDHPTLPPLPTHPALPPSLDGLFPPSLPNALWQIRLVIQGAPSLIEENKEEVAARFKSLLDHILSTSSAPSPSSYDGAVRVDFTTLAAALGAGSKLRGSVDPLLKEAEEAPLPSSCAEAAAAAVLPTFMVVEGNGPVVKEVLAAALTSETFPSIFDVPSDYCGLKVSQIIMA
ncbi:Hypothetical protein NocV09_02401020 [Nannochloropsis oceanica]